MGEKYIQSQRGRDNAIVRALRNVGRAMGFTVDRQAVLRDLARDRDREKVLARLEKAQPSFLKDGKGLQGTAPLETIAKTFEASGVKGRGKDIQVEGKKNAGEDSPSVAVVAVNNNGVRATITVLTR